MSKVGKKCGDFLPSNDGGPNCPKLGVRVGGLKKRGSCVEPLPFATGIRLIGNSIEKGIGDDAGHRPAVARPLLAPCTAVGIPSAAKPPLATTTAAAEGKPKEETAPSYTYWVREKTPDAAPLPVPRKLNPGDQPNNQTPTHLGSAWNRLFDWISVELNAVDYNFGSVGSPTGSPFLQRSTALGFFSSARKRLTLLDGGTTAAAVSPSTTMALLSMFFVVEIAMVNATAMAIKVAGN
nr:Activator of Hsp90 ATPase [Ipomoea batatas]GMD96693.1 Activator of Hsp90 ATPase [Ipomoea batatas]